MNLLSYTLFSVGLVNPSELVAATEGASALSTIQNDGAARTLCEEKIHAESAPFVVSSDHWGVSTHSRHRNQAALHIHLRNIVI